jgi:GNAT superfamily N-acetyltransferase
MRGAIAKNKYAELDEFVEAGIGKRFTSNALLKFGPLVVFVRVATHHLDGALTRTLDIGRIEVNPSQQGKGIFSKFLNHVERLAHKNGLAVYVESIQNEALIAALTNRGYELDAAEFCPSASFNTTKLNEKYKAVEDCLSL